MPVVPVSTRTLPLHFSLRLARFHVSIQALLMHPVSLWFDTIVLLPLT